MDKLKYFNYNDFIDHYTNVIQNLGLQEFDITILLIQDKKSISIQIDIKNMIGMTERIELIRCLQETFPYIPIIDTLFQLNKERFIQKSIEFHNRYGQEGQIPKTTVIGNHIGIGKSKHTLHSILLESGGFYFNSTLTKFKPQIIDEVPPLIQKQPEDFNTFMVNFARANGRKYRQLLNLKLTDRKSIIKAYISIEDKTCTYLRNTRDLITFIYYNTK